MLAEVLGFLLLAPHPESLDAMLKLRNANSAGWGVPMGSNVLTVEHLQGDLSAETPLGEIVSLKSEWEHKEKDLRFLSASKPFAYSIKIATKRPEVGDRVYYRVYLFGKASSWTSGTVLGLDDDGDLIVAGWFHPGTSGSGVLNESGELVGIASSGANWSAREPEDGDNHQEAYKKLFIRDSFPPALACIPINGWPKNE
jgi:S1-C subfamily serine protease